MNQQPDNLFREKLGSFHKAAPVSAWDKIEAGLEKKKTHGIWLKVAASLLVFALATFLLWPDHETGRESRTASQDVKPDAVKPAEKKTIVTPAPPVAENTLPVIASWPTIKKAKSPVLKHEQKEVAPEVTSIVPEEDDVIVADLKEETTESVLPETSFTAETVIAGNLPADEEAVTLVYTAEEVNEKYLDKEALAKATSSQKKSSTFRKLLDKAYDLKNNQDPLGELRQKKNEILALNFKNDKQRSQNK